DCQQLWALLQTMNFIMEWLATNARNTVMPFCDGNLYMPPILKTILWFTFWAWQIWQIAIQGKPRNISKWPKQKPKVFFMKPFKHLKTVTPKKIKRCLRRLVPSKISYLFQLEKPI